MTDSPRRPPSSWSTRSILGPLAALLAVFQLSCASAGLTPMKQSMPVARAALQPDYRFFYDTLGDYGEWVLIEPYGYVFRPTVYFDSWRPFGNGFWVPTDLYGWVWVSAEPFGWATYHYGQWLYDPYQRWVWIPGLDWAPARVAWEANDDYVGWAPLMPRGASYSSVPGGAFTYVRAGNLADTDLKGQMMSERDLGNRVATAKPVENLTENEGKTFNRGPNFLWVERATGPLRRARIDDLIPPRGSGDDPLVARPARAPKSTPGVAPADSLSATHAAAERAARAAQSIVERGEMVPDRLPVVRPFGVPVIEEPKPRPVAPRRATIKKHVVKPDSTR